MWRGVSLRQLALLLLGPMIVETVWSAMIYWMGLSTTAIGYPPRTQNIVVLLPALGYAASSLIAGRWVTPRHATRLLIVMLTSAALLGLSAVFIRSFALFIVLGPLLGLCIGHYYVPFQIRMGHVQPFRTLAWTVAFYNIAWGTGGAIGPYLAGSTEHLPWAFTITICTLALVHGLLVLLAATAPKPADDHHPTAAFASTARQRRLGWIAFGAAGLMMRGACFTLVPDFVVHRGWPIAWSGLMTLGSYAMIPLGAMLWAKLRHQMVRPWLMVLSLLIAAGGLGAMPLTHSWISAMLCLIAVGIGESCTVFHTLYYSNADPSPTGRARSIATVETLAGCGSVVGPALLGQLASTDATQVTPWWFGGGVLLAVAGYITFTAAGRTADAPAS